MKSQLLNRQLQEIFAGGGEERLRGLLAGIEASHGDLARGVARLLEAADGTYAMYANLQHWQNELSGDALSDWNLRSGNIESGRKWKTLLGYEAAEGDDSVAGW